MLSPALFRHAKPGIFNVRALVIGHTVDMNWELFTDAIIMEPINRCLFDVLDENGKVLSREEGLRPDYWFESGELRVRVSGNYQLRTYSNVLKFDHSVINVGRKYVNSDGGAFPVRIPFWPQVVTQPESGIARVSNDGRQIAYASQGYKGQVAFSYRWINMYGQTSEPACVTLTVI